MATYFAVSVGLPWYFDHRIRNYILPATHVFFLLLNSMEINMDARVKRLVYINYYRPYGRVFNNMIRYDEMINTQYRTNINYIHPYIRNESGLLYSDWNPHSCPPSLNKKKNIFFRKFTPYMLFHSDYHTTISRW